jgi:hypothetical protein
MSRLNVSNLFNENEDGSANISGISTFSSPNYFVPPSGSTAQRPSSPGEGMIMFNTDSGHLEYYNGLLWVDVIVNNNELGNQLVTNSAGGTGTRGVIGGGFNPSALDVIEYITISTLGNSQDFGNLTQARGQFGALASRVRGVWGGGTGSPAVDTIEYITISSTGDALDFGNLIGNRKENAGLSNETRGIFMGGGVSEISYITIASTGDAVDFGDLESTNTTSNFAAASSVRGVIAGGSLVDTIRYITISTTGNSVDFGNLTNSRYGGAGLSNSTRAVFGGGWAPNITNLIDFITIATTGNAQDFGDLTAAGYAIFGYGSSPTRGVFGPRSTNPGPLINTIDYVELLSTGNAVDFGDALSAKSDGAGFSNGHGGL